MIRLQVAGKMQPDGVGASASVPESRHCGSFFGEVAMQRTTAAYAEIG